MNGEDLKKRREELGLSLTEVSLVTKISLRVLHAIEAMDKAQLPAGIFLKGLVKSYALHLKLDADSVTKAYLAILNPAPPSPAAPISETNNTAPVQAAEHTTQFEKPKEKSKEKADKHPPEPFRIPMQAIGIGVAIVAVVIMLIVGQKMNSYKSEVAVTITQTKPEAESSQSTVPAIIPMLQSNVSSEKPVDSAAAAASTPAATPFPVPVPGTAVTPPVEEVAAPATSKPPTPAPASTTIAKVEEVKPELKIEPQPEVKPEVKVETKTASAKPKQLIFEALDKVNILIKKDGKQYRISLQPDEVHTLNYSETIEVEVSDGGAVNLIQNGHDNGVAGDLGKPKKMSL